MEMWRLRLDESFGSRSVRTLSDGTEESRYLYEICGTRIG